MKENIKLNIIIEISPRELTALDKLIKSYRKKYIRTSGEIVDTVFTENSQFIDLIKEKQISKSILELREIVWKEYLVDEGEFNIVLLRDLYKVLDTPKQILDSLLTHDTLKFEGADLRNEIVRLCGEYAGRIYPYIYRISLSNTNSRRSRAGKTFESIIYKVYEILEYSFDSQGKVGRKTFNDLGLGKKVDSILPGVEAYGRKRNKTIIGTMKTSLRERWQEVAEEIERTKIPQIHLLTVDEKISKSKALEMNNHNITIVVYDWVANSDFLSEMRNIISFEEYLFDEIPAVLKYWE